MGNCFISKPSSDKQEEKYKEQSIDLKDTSQNNGNMTHHDKSRANNNDIQVKVDELSQDRNRSNNQNLDVNSSHRMNPDQQQNLSESYYTEDADKKERKDKSKKVKKMQVDYGEETTIYENINKIERDMSKADITFILKSLEKHFVFSQLSTSDKKEICKKMFYCENSKDYIFKEGEQASSFFIIEKGECQVIINGQIRRKLYSGDGFGELALLYGAKRSASIKCVEPCSFWAIDRVCFRKQVSELVSKEYDETRKFIEKTKFFNVMTEQQKDSITHVTISTLYKKKGHQVVCQGDIATSYYIVKKGSVVILKDGKIVNKMGEGEEFGEQALTEDSYRGATVITEVDNVVLLSIGRDQIQKVLGNQVKIIMFQNLQRWALEKNLLLSKLTKIQMEKIISKTKHEEKKKGDLIFEGNKTCNKLVFVLKGKLAMQHNNKAVAYKGDVFGEEWLSTKRMKEKISDNIIMDENGTISSVSYKTFFQVIGGTLESTLDRNKDSHEQFLKKYDGKEAEKYVNWKLEELTSIKKLGFGQFGSVYLCKHKKSKEYFALKVISKQQVIEQNLEKHLLQEKKVLENVHFPFIMKFIRTFRDSNNVFFLVEYVKGMELFDVIREIGLLHTYDSQFYIGSLLLCIEYLHMQSIIYRDIKPENIMVDYRGYMKLIDMGTAKFLKGKGGRTFTIIGTPHYMAPEIINGKGYTYSVDLWSVGICLYEFMCGGVPFAEEAEDPYEIYEEIIRKNSLVFPQWLKDSLAKKLMIQLLNKIPEMRLGNSFAALKANPWFDNFDWDRLMRYELKTPYIPPKDKLISAGEIKKMEELGINIIDELKKEQGNQKYIRSSAKDPNWDREF